MRDYRSKWSRGFESARDKSVADSSSWKRQLSKRMKEEYNHKYAQKYDEGMSIASAAYHKTLNDFQNAVRSSMTMVQDPLAPANQSAAIEAGAEPAAIQWEEIEKKLLPCWCQMLSWLCRMKADGKSRNGIGRTFAR